MANHFSALKRQRQNLKRAAHNRGVRTRLRRSIRDMRRAIASGDATQAKALLPQVVSTVDKTVKKGAIKENTANRFKSRLMTRLAAMGKTA